MNLREHINAIGLEFHSSQTLTIINLDIFLQSAGIKHFLEREKYHKENFTIEYNAFHNEYNVLYNGHYNELFSRLINDTIDYCRKKMVYNEEVRVD